jgi:tRNA modification GTPase
VLCWNQVDRAGARPIPPAAWLGVGAVVATSGVRGEGLDELRRALSAVLEATAGAGEAGPVARELARRHVRGLEAAGVELDAAFAVLDEHGPLDLAAEHLRRASAGLDEIRGGTTPEDLLDRIFARFCLGK